ncbi:hypothetical protein QYG89_14240 [Bacillus sp. B190/17]|uniref:Uncharacterized protein n=1 Tax=Bacillus lumedeiriae TaxID=3058829 RepID=A0ABW8IBD2_9BACI
MTSSYFFTHGNWLSKTEIQFIQKQTDILHSQTVQAIADKKTRNCEKRTKKAKYLWGKRFIIVQIVSEEKRTYMDSSPR